MNTVVSVVFLLLALVVVSRRLPGRQWPVVLAATLAVVLAVVALEAAGWWPAGWRVR